ncbi:MAG: hypothetical protein IH602_21825 [Bryobacteraceae bacterium]|nr:hypothetical protein [Bryobacteraceae bacterium]
MRPLASVAPHWLRIRTELAPSLFEAASIQAVVAAAASQLLILAGYVVAGHALGVRSFGELNILSASVNMLGTFAGLGLGLTATRFVAALRVSDPIQTGEIIGACQLLSILSSGAVALCLALGSEYFAGRVLSAPGLSIPLRISSLLLLTSTLGGVQIGIVNGLERFSTLAFLHMAKGLLTFVALWAGSTLAGLNGVLWGLVAAGLAHSALLHWKIRSLAAHAGLRIRIGVSLKVYAVFSRFALPTLLSSLLLSPVTWLTNVLLASQPGGYRELGIFGAAFQWRQALLFLPSQFSQITIPRLTSLHVSGGGSSFRQLLRWTVVGIALLAIGFGVPVALFSGPIMGLYGEDFSGGALVLVALVVATALNLVSNVLGQALVAAGRMWLGFGLNLVWAAALVLLTVLLLPRSGSIGLAVAYCGAYAVHLGLSAIVARRISA